MGDHEKAPDESETPGGLGGRSARGDDGLTEIKRDRLERQTADPEWPELDYETKAAIVKRQVEIATSDRASFREATSAAKCLTTMNGQNMEKQKRSDPQGGTTNIQINGDVRISNPDERRAAILGRIAALRDRAGADGDRRATEAPNDPQPAVSQPPAD